MADRPPTMPPPSDPFPGSRTPGWNDPPTLQYNPQCAGTNLGRVRLNLNKRVAFPLQGTVGCGIGTAAGAASKPTAIVPPNQASYSSGLPPPSSLPGSQPIAVVHPMPNMSAQPPNPRLPISTIAEATVNNTTIELPAGALQSTLRVLRAEITAVRESINVRREEIERRLGIIEQLWQSGNLSPAVQEKLYQLAKAMADKNYNLAMETYTAMATNNADECATWAVALRHVVLTLQPALEVSGENAAVHATEATTTASSDGNSNISASNVVTVPTMFVPAMPRQPTSTEPSSIGFSASSQNPVQHI